MTTKHTFGAGDRVVASDLLNNGAPGTIDRVGLSNQLGGNEEMVALVRFDAPNNTCYYLGNSARYFSLSALTLIQAAPAVETPPAPFAVSSKPRPKAPIKPGSRHEQVLKHLTTGKSLTQGEAILLGYGTRVAATIHDLRRRGHNITTTMKEDIHGAPYAEYRLVTRGANGNRKAA